MSVTCNITDVDLIIVSCQKDIANKKIQPRRAKNGAPINCDTRFHQLAFSNRTGWIRLGIVLSLAWFLSVSIYAGIEYHSVKKDLANRVPLFAMTFSISPQGVTHSMMNYQTFIANCSGKSYDFYSCTPRFGNIALLALAPIAVAWVIILLMIYTIIWVCAGFKGP